MMQRERSDVYIIPPNFAKEGTLFSGRIEGRNAFEAAVLFIVLFRILFFIDVSIKLRIYIGIIVILPLTILAVVGVNGESLLSFIIQFIRFVTRRRVVTVPDGQYRLKRNRRIRRQQKKQQKQERKKKKRQQEGGVKDRKRSRSQAVERAIRIQISYDALKNDHPYDRRVEEILGLILDVMVSTAPKLRINREEKAIEIVKAQFAKLTKDHVEFVLQSMDDTSTKARNIRAVLLTALYNSVNTINSYYGNRYHFHLAEETRREMEETD